MKNEKNDLKSLMCPGFDQAVSAGEEDGVALADLLVGDSLEAKVTDIHLDPQGDLYRIKFRVGGQLYPVAELPREAGEQLVRSIEVDAGIDTAAQADRREGGTHLGPEKTSVRVASVSTVQGPKLSLRLLESARVEHDIRELGMTDADQAHLLDWTENSEGMVLCVGPTGCGKSTTCYSLLNEMKSGRNILTLEDPVEYTIDGLSQINLDPNTAGQPSTYAEGVYDILRHDPDALFLGEIRDQETAHAAVNASFSGHVVLSTMHSRDPASVITLLRSMGAADYEIAASISLVIGQRILSRLCPECRVRREPHGFEKTAARKHGVVLQAAWDAQGCSACAGTGQRGLTAVFELWRLEEADHEAILDHADEKTLRSRIRERGVPSLATAAIERAAAGKIRMDQALALL